MSNSKVVEMEGQAEGWFVRLQEPDCTDDERVGCERWRAQSPAHEAAFRAVEDIWWRSIELGNDPALDPALAEVLREAERGKAPGARFPFWLLPLAAVLVIVMARLLWINMLGPPGIIYDTALGERRSVELADGTVVVLDTRTAVVVRYSGRQRLVELQTGQAHFQVARDPARPFIVQAAGGSVTAVGTRFQVRVEDANATVTLEEGVVRVEAPAGGLPSHPAATLSPGQQLRFDRDGRQWAIDRVDLEVASAWTQGSLFVKNWRLEDLVAEMNRYSATKLRLVDPALAEIRISGTFRTGDQQALVLVLEHGWSVRASSGAGDEILLSRQPVQR